jgi:hypothetical protein
MEHLIVIAGHGVKRYSESLCRNYTARTVSALTVLVPKEAMERIDCPECLDLISIAVLMKLTGETPR